MLFQRMTELSILGVDNSIDDCRRGQCFLVADRRRIGAHTYNWIDTVCLTGLNAGSRCRSQGCIHIVSTVVVSVAEVD